MIRKMTASSLVMTSLSQLINLSCTTSEPASHISFFHWSGPYLNLPLLCVMMLPPLLFQSLLLWDTALWKGSEKNVSLNWSSPDTWIYHFNFRQVWAFLILSTCCFSYPFCFICLHFYLPYVSFSHTGSHSGILTEDRPPSSLFLWVIMDHSWSVWTCLGRPASNPRGFFPFRLTPKKFFSQLSEQT